MIHNVIVAIVFGTLVISGGPVGAGVTPEAKCKEMKARAAGREAAALLKAEGRNVKKTDPGRLGTDVSKARSKFSKAFSAVDDRYGCQNHAGSGDIETVVNAFVWQVTRELCPVCGDDSRGGGEECDGSDAFDCPGLCQPNCRCPEATCGNAVLEAGEGCDPPCAQGPCAAGEICGVACTCVPEAPCSCGGANAPTTMELAVGGDGGICGVVSDFDGDPIRDLECGNVYEGGDGSGIPVPFGTSVHRVQCCNGTMLGLTNMTATETGSIATCTSTGCLFGAPVPVVHPVASLSTCIIDEIAADTFGFANCSTGDANVDLRVRARRYLSGDILGKRCAGGTNPGTMCADDSDCAPGTCVADPAVEPCPICNPTTLRCNGGPNDGAACTPVTGGTGAQWPTSQDCPPSPVTPLPTTRSPYTPTTGMSTMHADDGQFCGFCRDVQGEASGCFEGDASPACPDSAILACKPASGGDMSECGTPVPCDFDSECLLPYESCEQRTPGAFGLPAASIIAEWGSPGGDLSDRAAHDVTLGGVYCVSPTFNYAVDVAADLPGPGAVALPGTLRLRPSPSGAFVSAMSGVLY